MAKLSKNDIAIIRERIIVTIKRNGELIESGHRMDYDKFRPALYKDEIIANDDKLRSADYSVKGIISYFEGQNDMEILFSIEPPNRKGGIKRRWVQFVLKRVITSKEIIEAARNTIKDIKTQHGVDINEPLHIPVKQLSAELSRRIPFFELYLDKNKMTLKEFVKSLDELNKESSHTDKNQIVESGKEETKEDASKKKKKESKSNDPTVWVKKPINSDEKTESIIIDVAAEQKIEMTICNTIIKKGELRNGIRQIVMGKLCVELIQSSKEFNEVRDNYIGTTKDLILKRFGSLITVDNSEGVDWVSLSESGKQKMPANGYDDQSKAGKSSDPTTQSELKTNAGESSKIVDENMSSEETDKIVREDILNVIREHGTDSKGNQMIVLGSLVNNLVANSTAYLAARDGFSGPARQYLLEHFGDLLTIEFIDGKDWVSIPLPLIDGQEKEKESTKEKTEIKESPVIPVEPLTEAKSVTSVKISKAAAKRKDKAQELLIEELSTRNDEELQHIFLVMQLVHGMASEEITKTARKKTGSATSKNESVGVGGAAERILLNARAVLARNDVMNQITASMTTGEILDIIYEEIRMRTGKPPVFAPVGQSAITVEAESKNSNPYTQEVLTDVDYEGLDDWLPF